MERETNFKNILEFNAKPKINFDNDDIEKAS